MTIHLCSRSSRFSCGIPHRQRPDRLVACHPDPHRYSTFLSALKKAGRLNDSADSEMFGTNVVPLGIEIARTCGRVFIDVMRQVYSPDGYFQRIDALFLRDRFTFSVHQLPYWKDHRLAWAKRLVSNYVKFLVLAMRLMRTVNDAELSSQIPQAALGHHSERAPSSRISSLSTPLRLRCITTMRRSLASWAARVTRAARATDRPRDPFRV